MAWLRAAWGRAARYGVAPRRRRPHWTGRCKTDIRRAEALVGSTRGRHSASRANRRKRGAPEAWKIREMPTQRPSRTTWIGRSDGGHRRSRHSAGGCRLPTAPAHAFRWNHASGPRRKACVRSKRTPDLRIPLIPSVRGPKQDGQKRASTLARADAPKRGEAQSRPQASQASRAIVSCRPVLAGRAARG
jgi:hypothetical protein